MTSVGGDRIKLRRHSLVDGMPEQCLEDVAAQRLRPRYLARDLTEGTEDGLLSEVRLSAYWSFVMSPFKGLFTPWDL